MLLGEIFWELLCGARIQTQEEQSTLQRTQLRWVIGGNICGNEPAKLNLCNLSINAEISRGLEKFWELEHITEKSLFTPEKKFCMQLFSRIVTRKQDSHLMVRILIKQERLQQLGELRSTAPILFN